MIERFVLGSLLLFASASVVVAQGITEVHSAGPYTQAATGMTYPVEIGDFQRDKIIRYKDDGTDESTGYNRESPQTEISMTVYVFPSPNLVSFGSPQNVIDGAREHLCQAQFNAIQHEILAAHPDAVLVSQGDEVLVQSNATHKGYKAFYTDTNPNFFGRSDVKSRSDVYVFCYAGGKWTVEYRVDYPADYDASKPISDFMQNLIWTIPGEQ